ncbi:MAG: hypothetical protein JNM10_11520 [Planctomycetia bacterium]|nr:hypothetical protein [Planctomycetia bacterium]
MHRARCSRSRPFLAALAALVVLVGGGLEAWTALDRARAPGRASDLDAAATTARERPSPAAYERLAGAQAAAGLASDAATSAVIASRLAPGDARRAALAEAYVDGALRATLRGGLRPFAAAGAGLLLFLWVTGARRRAAARRREEIVAHALGRVVLAVEGDGQARGDLAVLRPGATGLVIDVHTDPALATVVDAPPLVVALSHAGAGRTVRLSPRRDAVGGAARFKVVGDALAEVLAHPGAWRVLVRADAALLAEATVQVEPAPVARRAVVAAA